MKIHNVINKDVVNDSAIDVQLTSLKEDLRETELIYYTNIVKHGASPIESTTWYIEVDNKIVCVCDVAALKSSKTGYIRSLYTMPNYRRKGYARKLMLHVLEQLSNYNMLPQISSHVDNLVAINFYKSLGFQIESTTMVLHK